MEWPPKGEPPMLWLAKLCPPNEEPPKPRPKDEKLPPPKNGEL